MAKHPDAIGYLNDLATEVNESWFTMICDLAAVSGVAILDQSASQTLTALYTNRASYLGMKPAAAAAAAPAVLPAPADFLDRLSGFSNFKLLGKELEVNFKKRISLVFGANGSGKSSICESLKVLAASEPPSRPIQNARAAGGGSPEFRFKFRSDAAQQVWRPASGYGPRRAVVKYFDTAIAIKNVKSAVDPARVMVLTPFKLTVFEWAKTLTTLLREVFQKQQQSNSARLTQALDDMRTEFAKFIGSPLSAIDEKSAGVLPAQILLGEKFSQHQQLADKLTTEGELKKAASEDGLKLLRAEHRELEAFLVSIDTLMSATSDLWAIDPAQKSKLLSEKQIEQNALAKALIPENGTLDGLLSLLRVASPLCNLQDAKEHQCPLCSRGLGAPEVLLFKQYYDLLAGELEKDIEALKEAIAKASALAEKATELDLKTWGKFTTIQAEMLAAAHAEATQIVSGCVIANEPMAEARTAYDSLAAVLPTWKAQLDAKASAIDAASKGRDQVIGALKTLRAEIEPLEYAQCVALHLDPLQAIQLRVERSKFWSTKLPTFIPLLSKITKKAKDAHEELVVADFEARLNAEYKALTEKDMAAFGVILARKGADAAVTVLPQIGGKDLEGVLSEGEQRVHALALFFAELETCPQSVLVFDDPISSFDYNYIANYCSRLRDFAFKHPQRQVIVLTHNWEFFVQLQTTLNQAGLDPHLSVQVLENCTVVADYSEKIDDLKNDIESVLNALAEPSKSQKEEIAGKMRRLIEVVVNTHVFNSQRHQYKQKSQAISAFQSFTKIVPLLPAEATTLRDLYAKLSITEHDDPRNAYVNTDKAMFQTRYAQIQGVEIAVAARKP